MSKSVAAQMQEPTPMEGIDEVPAAAQSGASKAVASNSHISMIDKMKARFAGERRVPVKVHNDGPVFVQVNGYSFLIRENERVEVPESVARLLDEAGYI